MGNNGITATVSVFRKTAACTTTNKDIVELGVLDISDTMAVVYHKLDGQVIETIVKGDDSLWSARGDGFSAQYGPIRLFVSKSDAVKAALKFYVERLLGIDAGTAVWEEQDVAA